MSKRILTFVLILSVAILAISFSIVVLNKTKERQIEQALEQANQNYFEEALEDVFLTRDVVVTKIIIEKHSAIVTARANNKTYKVLYEIQDIGYMLPYYDWKFIKYIEVGEE